MRLLRIVPWIVLPVAMLAASCRDPTQITVRVTTDLACNPTPGGLAKAWIASAGTEVEAPSCTPQTPYNYIGTIVIVPGPAGDDAKVDVTVVGSVNAASNDTCLSSKQNVGDCLVVHRRLSFIPHAPLSLPIRLDSRCLNVQCKDTQTCIDGVCNSIDVNPPPTEDAGAPDVGPDAAPPVPLDALDLFAGQDGTCALLKSNDVVCWGNNGNGQLLAKGKPLALPEAIASLSGVTEMALGGRHGCGLFPQVALGTKIQCWGDNSLHQIAGGPIASSSAPVEVPLPKGVTPSQLHAGKDFTCVLGRTKLQLGSETPVYCWGDDKQGQSSGSGTSGTTVSTATPVANVVGALLSLGDDFACAGTAPSSLCPSDCPAATCWGDNALHQCLGSSDIAAPVSITIKTNIDGPAQVDTGASHVMLTLSSLVSYGWGNNADGQLPGATGTTVAVPTVVKPGDGPRALGAHHTCALLQGAVTCWGTSKAASAAPTLSGVKKLVGGSNHVCVIDAADHVQCWGSNQLGQLGSANPADVGPVVVGITAP